MKLKNWNISLLLLAIYLLTFHSWNYLSPSAVLLTAPIIGILWISISFNNRQYFLNRYDLLFHMVPGIDIVIEAFLPKHQDYDFYYCGIGFAITIAIYRHFVKV